ncbi:MAG: Nif3-like dinuclear metal center hexameric protein [Cyanobacteriota bacterium]
MTVNILEIAKNIELLAPIELAESWDNCGWQILCENNNINKALVTLTVELEDIKYAIKNNIDVIVSHHPVIFTPVKNLTPLTLPGQIILQAIKNNISIYSAHTNLDKIPGGVSDLLAEKLELNNIKPLIPEKYIPEAGLGRIGQLPEPTDLNIFLNKIKKVLNINNIKVVNQPQISKVQNIALCGGSGAGFINFINPSIDLYLTGDIKYHDALEAMNFVLVDADHTNTEQFIVYKIAEILKKLNIDVETTESKTPWLIY